MFWPRQDGSAGMQSSRFVFEGMRMFAFPHR
jgi:hypothetical protein